MPWEELKPMDLKVMFITAYLAERDTFSRAKGSIEFRMQNISTVLTRMGLDRIEGYKPAKNVGPA